MTTRHRATMRAWNLGGFNSPRALEKALIQLRAAGTFHPSERGGGARDLDCQELAWFALSLRGVPDAIAETGRVAALVFDGPTGRIRLVDRLASILQDAGSAIVEGREPIVPRSLTICHGGPARLKVADGEELFQPASVGVIPEKVRLFTEIPNAVWRLVCDLAADFVAKSRNSVTSTKHGSAEGFAQAEATRRPRNKKSADRFADLQAPFEKSPRSKAPQPAMNTPIMQHNGTKFNRKQQQPVEVTAAGFSFGEEKQSGKIRQPASAA